MKKILLNILLITLLSCNNNVDVFDDIDSAIDVTKFVNTNRKIDKNAIKEVSSIDTVDLSVEGYALESDSLYGTSGYIKAQGLITGTVLDLSYIELFLPNVQVVDANYPTNSTITDNLGYFSITLPAGNQVLRFSLTGFKTVYKNVLVKPGDTVNIEDVILRQEKYTENTEIYIAAEFTTGEAFFKQNCSICHKADKDNGFPSVKKIAAIYKDKKEDLVKFLKGEGKAVVEPKRYESEMKPNLEKTKELSATDLHLLVDYILSVK